jgi:hypothetical protein
MQKIILLREEDINELINTSTVINDARNYRPGYNLETQLNEYIKALVSIIDSKSFSSKGYALIKYYISVLLLSHLQFEDIRRN